jgi:hypothetical protein
VVEGLFFLATALLIVTGTAKLIDYRPTEGALRIAGLPARKQWVWLLACSEIAIAIVAFIFGGVVGGLAVAAIYLAFTGFVVIAMLRRLPLQSCGCFGKVDTPVSVGHLIVNLGAVASGIVVAVIDAPGLVDVLSRQPLYGIPYLGFVAVGTYLLALVLTKLPFALVAIDEHQAGR